ncbi:MAG: hypothetical protein ACOYN6_11125 [Ignavibacteria bacterium]
MDKEYTFKCYGWRIENGDFENKEFKKKPGRIIMILLKINLYSKIIRAKLFSL